MAEQGCQTPMLWLFSLRHTVMHPLGRPFQIQLNSYHYSHGHLFTKVQIQEIRLIEWQKENSWLRARASAPTSLNFKVLCAHMFEQSYVNTEVNNTQAIPIK